MPVNTGGTGGTVTGIGSSSGNTATVKYPIPGTDPQQYREEIYTDLDLAKYLTFAIAFGKDATVDVTCNPQGACTGVSTPGT